MPMPRRPRQFSQQSVRQQQSWPGRPRRRSRSAVGNLSHRLRPQLRRILFSDLVRHRARPSFPRTKRPARRSARRPTPACSAYRNPGEDINQAVSINGQPYSSSPNAFRYRQEFNPSCSCKAAGQTWSDALKIDRRQGRRRRPRRHHRHRREREEDVAAAAEGGSGRGQERRRRGRHDATPRPPTRRPLTLRRPAPQRTTSRSVRSARPSSRPGSQGIIRQPAGYPSNASADPRLPRDTSRSSGSGSGWPLSRNRLVMG